ncbi:hypothetical protein ACFE04_013188 [Oxalis oulophora]
MATVDNPKTWIPYMQNNDCSQGFCSKSCPQWCFVNFPPPPPYEFPDDTSPGPNFSPLVIAIIGILASAFLLVSYYTVISKYCGKSNSTSREDVDHDLQLDDNHNPSLHEPWHVDAAGLDESLIKTITICKFKKGDGLIQGADCSVCLSEFVDNENLRLLPKCSHAFHVQCIDKWLKSHSTCPLCRANIISIGVNSQPPLVLPVIEVPDNESESNQNAIFSSDSERNNEEETMHSVRGVPRSPLRVIGNLEERHTVIEIVDEGYNESVRRSFSMDHSHGQGHLLVADLLRLSDDDNIDHHDDDDGVGSSKETEGSSDKSNRSKRVRHCAMKRSFSSGRFLVTRQKTNNIPV